MKYDPEKHHRKSIRLQGYDYTSAGMYFITLCSQQRECLFGEIVDGEMRLNEYGQIVRSYWLKLPNHHPRLQLDAFVVMPNHMHGILVLTDTPVGAGFGRNIMHHTDKSSAKPAPTPPASNVISAYAHRHGIPEMIRGFKTFSARSINQRREMTGVSVWQRNYYVRVASPIGDTYHS